MIDILLSSDGFGPYYQGTVVADVMLKEALARTDVSDAFKQRMKEIAGVGGTMVFEDDDNVECLAI